MQLLLQTVVATQRKSFSQAAIDTRHRLAILLLGVVLVIAQLGVSLHAAEHLAHEETESCEVFVIAEKHAAADTELHNQQVSLPLAFVFAWLKTSSSPFSLQQSYLARAPPAVNS